MAALQQDALLDTNIIQIDIDRDPLTLRRASVCSPPSGFEISDVQHGVLKEMELLFLSEALLSNKHSLECKRAQLSNDSGRSRQVLRLKQLIGQARSGPVQLSA